MNRSQLKRRISETIGKYGKEKGNEKAFLVNVIMGYIDLYYDKFYIRYNDSMLASETRKAMRENKEKEKK